MGVHKKFFNYRPKVLESITESMNPRAFIETESVRKYLQARAARVASDSEVTVVYDKENYTDGKKIHVSPVEAARYAKTHEEALMVLAGYVFHEALHIIRTDFDIYEEYRMGHFDGKILPEPLPKYSSYRINVLSIIEDGAIEEWGKKEYPAFLKQSIEFANEVSFSHRKSLTQMYEERVHAIDILFEAFTDYMIMGVDPEFPADMEGHETLYYECRPLLARAKRMDPAKERCRIAEDIFQKIKPVVVKELGKSDHFSVYMPAKPSKHEAFDPKKQLEAQEARAEEEEQAAKRPQEANKKLTKDELMEMLVPVGAGEEGFTIEELLGAAARDIYDKEIDEEYANQLILDINNMNRTSLGSMHNTIKVKFTSADPEEYEQYYAEHRRRVSRLRPKIKMLQKSILAVIQREHDTTTRNLYAGNQYRQPFRADKKCCAIRKDLSDEADLFIFVLVDASGSMTPEIETIKDALTMFSEVCRSLSLPITVMTHMASANKVTINTLIDGNMRKNTFAGIETFTTGGGTRDGVALMNVAEYLRTRRETQKILIAISDGQPWHTCQLDMNDELYAIAAGAGVSAADAKEFFSEYSNFSNSDIRNVIRKTGIRPVGVALAPTMEDAQKLNENISGLYPESFATDLNHLAKKLSDLIGKRMFDI